MSYFKKFEWELVPKDLPRVRRNCPKCNEKQQYINSKKFRVNANKNSIDIWMIYQCEKCKSTWNMTIYERIRPDYINKDEYERFLSNDEELAEEYSFNPNMYNKNKAEIFLDEGNYKLIQKKAEKYHADRNELVIELFCRYPLEVRVDRLLSDELGISRSRIKRMSDKGLIFIEGNKNSLNTKVRDKMLIHLLDTCENAI